MPLVRSRPDSEKHTRLTKRPRFFPEDTRWCWPRRLFYAAAVPLGAPVLRLWRLFAGVVSRPARWLPALESLPVALVIYIAGAWGETVGYLCGGGETAAVHARS